MTKLEKFEEWRGGYPPMVEPQMVLAYEVSRVAEAIERADLEIVLSLFRERLEWIVEQLSHIDHHVGG